MQLTENEIKEVQENVRYWLLEDERYPGEQEEKLAKIERLIERTITRS